MKCQKCKEELEENTKYCTNCGTKLEEEVDDGKLTYSQNPNIKTTYNSDTSVYKEYKEKVITPATEKDSKTTIALVFGVLGMGLSIIPIFSFVGLILAITSKERNAKRTTAIVLNSISLFMTFILYVMGFTALFY